MSPRSGYSKRASYKANAAAQARRRAKLEAPAAVAWSRRFGLSRRPHTCQNHLHRKDFAGQRIEHQAERFERHGPEECAVVPSPSTTGDVAACSRISN